MTSKSAPDANGQPVGLNDDEREEMREIFRLFDSNNDGSICPEELKVAMQHQGLNPSDAELKSKCYFYSYNSCKYLILYNQVYKGHSRFP